ncbi:MAG: AMP-binding protein, partial [Pseudomonadota bacterium]
MSGANATHNFYAMLDAAMARAGETIAFEEENGAATSYAALRDDVARMAGALTDLGVTVGDRVTAQVEKSRTNVLLYLATLQIGAVYNPLNTAYTPAELDYFIGDAKPALLTVDPASRDALAPIATGHGVTAIETLDATGTGSLADRASTAEPNADIAACGADDLACLLYTSGTTGRSKGAMITHGNLSSNAEALHSHWRFAPGDVVLHALPIYHVHGLFVCLHTALLNGSMMLWLPRFDLDAVIERLPRATVMMGVPTFYTRLLSDSRFDRELVAGMRLFVAGSAPLLAETHTEFEARTGHRILERYGMTE